MRAATAAALYGCLSLAAAPTLPQEGAPGQLDSQSADVQQLHQAAERGDADAQFRLGSTYFGAGVTQDHTEAAKWFRLAAEQRHADAQNYLGIMYKTGAGVTQDDAEAAKWFRRAAEQGRADAQNNLGILYDIGQGVPQDHAEAAKWRRRAAEQGYASAQLGLGLMYYNGEGVPQDYVAAHMWLNLAAARFRGETRERAATARDSVASKMTGEAIHEAQRLAREWRPQVASANANAEQRQ